MAGMHQIWKMPLDEKRDRGRMPAMDAKILSMGRCCRACRTRTGFASFAQPSGLTSDGKQLFVADSEGSTVRSVPFDARGQVETLVGLTGTLFDFGDVDGSGPRCAAAASAGRRVGGREAVRRRHVQQQDQGDRCRAAHVPDDCRHWQGGQRGCRGRARATFNEPGGISAAGGKLYVADTNNHVIRVVELAAPYRVSTLKIEGLAAPQSAVSSTLNSQEVQCSRLKQTEFLRIQVLSFAAAIAPSPTWLRTFRIPTWPSTTR